LANGGFKAIPTAFFSPSIGEIQDWQKGLEQAGGFW